MSDKEARLRLDLAAAGLQTMLQQIAKQSKEIADGFDDIGDEAQKAERKLHPMLQSTQKGLGAAKTAVVDLGGKVKTIAGQALTLGGALSVAGAVMESTRIVSKYHDIAFAIRTGTKEAQDWQQVQEHVEGVAQKWARSNDEVATSYDAIFARTKDLDFAKKASSEVAKTAAGTGRSIELLTKMAGDMGDKFGITAGQIEEAMAAVVSTGRVDEFAQNMHEIGASARAFGMEGVDGLKKYIGMMEASKHAMKDVPAFVGAMRAMMEPLQNIDARKTVEQKLKIKLSDENGELDKDAIKKILEATGGSAQELRSVFAGEAGGLATEWGKIYSKGFDSISGTFKEKSQAGMDAFEKAMLEAVPNTEDIKRDLTKAAEDAASSPEENLKRAVQKVTNAFAQPKMVDAINKVADKLPALADILANFVSFAADHPLLTGVGMLGAKPARAFASSMLGDGARWAGRAALDYGKGTAVVKGAATWGKDAGAAITASMAGSNKWTTMGKALGVTAAGVIAYEVTKAFIDSRVNANAQAQNDAVGAGVQASAAIASGDMARMHDARSKLKQKIGSLDERAGGVGGFFDTAMLEVGKAVTGDSSLQNPNQVIREDAAAELKRLEAAIEKGSKKGGEEQTKAAREMERAIKRAADHLMRVPVNQGGGGEGTNGLPQAPYYTPQ